MSTQESKDGLGLPSVILIGFTFIANITFCLSFNSILWDGQRGVGLNIIWIDIIEGIAAFICSWSFAVLVKNHNSVNGGLSQYARSALGKFWGFLGGMLNYFSFPVIVSALIVTAMRSNFSDSMWGSWTNLYLDLIGLVIFIAASSVVYFGVKKYKLFGNIIGILSWVLTLFIVVFAVTLICYSKGSNINHLLKLVPPSKMELSSFQKAFMSIFFTFAGIETFITSGVSIKNRSKNLPIGIVIIMILVTLFYVIFNIILIAAITLTDGKGYDSNPTISIFEQISNHFGHKALKQFGMWTIIICTVFLRFNSMVNLTLFSGTTLEPLSAQGYIPPKMSEINKKTELPLKAITFSIMLFLLSFIVFLLIPDIIQGITNKSSVFNYAQLAQTTSFILVSIYVLSITSCLVLGFRKKIAINWFEKIAFMIVLIFLGFLLIMYIYDDILKPMIFPNNSSNENRLQNILGGIIQLIYISSIFITTACLYFFYHKKRLEKIKENKDEYIKFKKYEENFVVSTK